MWQRISHSPDRGSVANHRICCSESLLILFVGCSTCFDSDCLISPSRRKVLPAFRADSLGSALHTAQRSYAGLLGTEVLPLILLMLMLLKG